MSQDPYRFLLRMPAALRDELRDSAQARGRSLNGEIVARLEASLVPPQHHVTRVSAFAAAATLSLSLLGAGVVGSAVGAGAVALHAGSDSGASKAVLAHEGLKRSLIGDPVSGS